MHSLWPLVPEDRDTTIPARRLRLSLVRAIAGRVRLDGGSIELMGRTLRPESPRGELGVVPQEIAIYPLLSARENLEVFGRLQGLTGQALASRVAWALAWTALDARASEPVKRFSGGMRRRLNIACGVLHEPRVLLLDEPTFGVDPQSRERIYEMLAALRAGGTSLLLATLLMMSALGGSMFPRFLMSEKMQKLGLLTFNGWALDGYVKVFWRNAPLLELCPSCSC